MHENATTRLCFDLFYLFPSRFGKCCQENNYAAENMGGGGDKGTKCRINSEAFGRRYSFGIGLVRRVLPILQKGWRKTIKLWYLGFSFGAALFFFFSFSGLNFF